MGASFRIFASSCPNAAAGGVAILVRKASVGEGVAISEETHIPGRLLPLKVKMGEAICMISVLHNFAITVAQTRPFCLLLEDINARSRADPGNAMAILGGDFNFRDEGEVRHDLRGRPCNESAA